MCVSAPIAIDVRRRTAIRALDLSSTIPDGFFDELARTAAAVCDTPIGLVVLVDEDRHRFVGSTGVPNIREVKDPCPFAAHLVASGRRLLVPDTALDSRFSSHALVTGPFDARFFSGAPIRCGHGVTLGSLCVVDHRPRRLDRRQLRALRHLAAATTRALVARAAAVRTVSRLRHQATHDALTGLLNRATYEAALGDALAASRTGTDAPGAVLHIDLDRFKVVNDTCGHAAGDQLLRQIGGIVSACVESEDLVARLGADEFGVLLRDRDPRQAHATAQKICDQLDAFRFVHEGRRFRIGASIGLVSLGAPWTSVIALLQAADASCRAAKDGGRSRVHVWQVSDTALASRQDAMWWVSRIELALDEDLFTLHAQRIEPIGDAATGLHFEVLLRMREPDGTIVLPAKFMAVAESFHLAPSIDRWVVRKAFDWMAQADRAGLAVGMMAINLSGQTLEDRSFHRDLMTMLRAATFDVKALCFEITETAAITHLAEARAVIAELRGFGVKIALDDFGSGAASFGYLKSLPVDFLKIDGQFVSRMLVDPIDRTAVRCFAEIAQQLGIVTIAECVEREDERDALRAIGVGFAQGNLIHAPEPLAALLSHASPQIARHPPIARRRGVTEVPFDLPNPNRLAIDEPAEVLLWADDLSISAERLREIVEKVGPMRAAIRGYVNAQRRSAGRVSTPIETPDC